MESNIRFRYNPNGNLEDVTTNGDRLYEGGKAVAQYFLNMAEEYNPDNWLPTDAVFIIFVRPDGMVGGPLQMKYKDGGWTITTNGWETDVDVPTQGGALKISFIVKRYSITRPKVEIRTRTTEQRSVTIYPSEGFTPLDIVDNAAEAILQAQSETMALAQAAVETSQSTADAVDNLLQPPIVSKDDSEIATVRLAPDGRLEFVNIEGADGADGKTPYIKEDAWWIGDFDTTIPATGPQGEEGDITKAVNALQEMIDDGCRLQGNFIVVDIASNAWNEEGGKYIQTIQKYQHFLGDNVLAFTLPQTGNKLDHMYDDISYENGDIFLSSTVQWEGKLYVINGVSSTDGGGAAMEDIRIEINRHNADTEAHPAILDRIEKLEVQTSDVPSSIYVEDVNVNSFIRGITIFGVEDWDDVLNEPLYIQVNGWMPPAYDNIKLSINRLEPKLFSFPVGSGFIEDIEIWRADSSHDGAVGFVYVAVWNGESLDVWSNKSYVYKKNIVSRLEMKSYVAETIDNKLGDIATILASVIEGV